jgi:hypothetical protein
MARDTKSELVDFLVHRTFYPVLMAQRAGPHKAKIEHVQDATRTEIERFRSYGSIKDVAVNFERDLRLRPASSIRSDLRLVSLPVLGDVHEEFERKARELGFDPNTLLTSPDSISNMGNMAVDQERISQRAYALWESAEKPDGAQDEHWQQARREIEAEDGATMSDQTAAAAMPVAKGPPHQLFKAER